MSNRRRVSVLVVIALLTALSVAPIWAAQTDVLRNVQNAFEREVGGIGVDSIYREKLMRQAEDLIRQSRQFDSPQFFLLVDRNHEVQKAFLAFYDTAEGKVTLIGGEHISTGNPKRRGYFETPTGVFENKPANMSYRALGTKNSRGWRGLGAKGSRVWDLGWQRTVKGHGEPMDIRMLVHATDPQFGEPRLGRVDSKGCIRIPAQFNRFLDYHGVLDREYETSIKAKYVLPAKRSPVPFAGKFIVVIDSEESREPAT
ncbi:MAG: hypothetical protein NUV90_01830 [Candidatus Parcubacteria bacterium]|nr:hypothetical protein [Candidatus Parcubacteria bacterium]